MAMRLDGIDHVHLYVSNREEAEEWYARALGMARVPELASWARGGGPLMIEDAGKSIHLAVFEGAAQPNRATVAFRATGADFLEWKAHLEEIVGEPIAAVDHGLCWSLYFHDPDGNPFEIASYEYEWVRERVG